MVLKHIDNFRPKSVTVTMYIAGNDLQCNILRNKVLESRMENRGELM
jgi:hypothetical protein